MARKANMRGRPGLIFVVVLVISIGILYLSWKSLMVSHSHLDDSAVEKENFQIHPKVPFDSGINSEVARRKSIEVSSWTENQGDSGAEKDFVIDDPNSVQETNDDSEHINEKKHKPVVSTVLPIDFNGDDQSIYFLPKSSKNNINKIRAMERFVHLDLKGAAPKISYLEKLLPLLKTLGATGLLVEYEDTFPYSGNISSLAAKNCYKKSEIDRVVSLAKNLSLTIIPLVQTFGHMEFVLKHTHMQHLRESAHTPQVIASSNNATYDVISEMIKQVMCYFLVGRNIGIFHHFFQ